MYLHQWRNINLIKGQHKKLPPVKLTAEMFLYFFVYLLDGKQFTGAGVISNNSKVMYSQDASIFIEPADGFELTGLKIDGASITPIESYTFASVENNHTIEATFTITQTKKMELF